MHRRVTRRHEGWFSVQADISNGDLISALVVLGFPGVVAILVKNRLTVDAVVTHPGRLALLIIGGPEDSGPRPQQGRLSVQTNIGRCDLVAVFVVLPFPSVISILVQDRLTFDAAIGP